MTDQQIIKKISLIRAKNNKNWMGLLGLAVKHAPKEAKKIMGDIFDCDVQISHLTGKLIGGKNENRNG